MPAKVAKEWDSWKEQVEFEQSFKCDKWDIFCSWKNIGESEGVCEVSKVDESALFNPSFFEDFLQLTYGVMGVVFIEVAG